MNQINKSVVEQVNYDLAVTKVVDDRAYHPILNYFAALPAWDGVPRLDTLLIDYLGAEDNAYIRAVTRKTMCGAVARVHNPGCKFDYMLVLNGPPGLGKSTLIERLGGLWYNDSLQLSDTHDKTAAEKLQGFWLLEIGELAGLRKAEVETLKGFISRCNDVYRASFSRRATPHLRQCIFIGTTNAETGYLRDTTGNRKFWPVKAQRGAAQKPWEITAEVRQQVWAEALVRYRGKEPLYLDEELSKFAESEQQAAMESDEREGLVREYLEKRLPENWKALSLYDRRSYLDGGEFGEAPEGTVPREMVCPQEIWAECFGKNPSDIKNSDSIAINIIMTKMEGWEKMEKPARFPIYGLGRGFKRVTSLL